MRWFGVVLVVGFACGGASPRPAAPATEDAPSAAAADVRGVVQEAYGSLGHGNREGCLPLMSDHVYAIGPGGDAIAARSDVVVALTSAFPSDKRHKIASHALRAVVSPGGASAFAWDQLDVDGVPYTASAVLVQEGGMWVAVAIDVARGGSKTAGGAGAAAAGPAIAAQVDAAAKPAVALFTAGAAAPEKLIDQLADGPEVVALGPGPRDVTRGGAAIHKAWKKALKKKPAMAVQGGVRAGATPDGQLVWIHANVVRTAQGAEPSPRRVFYVYARDGAGWRLTVAHEAAGR